MASKRIADLSATLSADTRDYEAGMKRAAKATEQAKGSIGNSLGGIEKIGLKLGLGLVGGGGALSMLTNEVRNVIQNIEKIPGVPASTIASIQQTRYAFEQSREGVDQAIAGVISFVSWSARAAGFAAGALVYGLDDAEQGYWAFARSAENAANAQAKMAAETKRVAEELEAANKIRAYASAIQDKTISEGTAALERRAKAKESYDRRDETQLERMNRLQQEANQTLNNIDPFKKTTPADIDALTSAYEKLIEVDKLDKSMREGNHSLIENAQSRLFGDTDSVVNAAWQREMDEKNQKLREMERMAHQVGYAFENAFEDAIFSGEKFGDVLENLGKELLMLAVRKSIIEPLAGAIGGGITKFFGGFFADGGTLKPGQWGIAGENGPEPIFAGSTGMTVVSNKDANGSGGSGNTYYIDARGADAGAVERIKQALLALAGPGVVEKRAMAAAYDQRRRG